jgi:hypothetical protein
MADLAVALPSADDVYHGVVVDAAALPADAPTFAARLDASLKVGRRGGGGGASALAALAQPTKPPPRPPSPPALDRGRP